MSDSHDSLADAIHPAPVAQTSTEGVPTTSSTLTEAINETPDTSLATTVPSHPNIDLGSVSIDIDAPISTLPPPSSDRNETEQDTGDTADQPAENDNEQDIELDDEGFDPATLANLAALSRIAHEEDDAGLDNEEEDDPARPSGSGEQDGSAEASGSGTAVAIGEGEEISGEQVNALVKGLKGAKVKRKRVTKRNDKERSESMPREKGSVAGDQDGGYSDDDDSLREKDEDDDDDDDSDTRGKRDKDGKYHGDGKRKRKRNRTVLSCTECHRRCDRNIPCNRCVRRGVASMCRMEAPIMPERKKRKPLDESPINYELGLRVQALESLIRAGTSMDADTANSAAMETILQATRAAGKGNVVAGNALASLSSAAGMDLSELESSERAGLLMEVLQQLSDASMPPRIREEPDTENGGPVTDDPWSSIPRARASLMPNPPATRTIEIDGTDHPHLDLTLQGFREDNGKIFIPPTVRYVEKIMRADKESVLAKDALPIQGDGRFLREGTRLVYGEESNVWKKGSISSVQTHTITGGIRVAANFLSRFPVTSLSGGSKPVYCPSPTTIEDEIALRESGLEIRRFRFLDQDTGAIDWAGAREDLQEAVPKSVVLMYVSGSIPTGMELNPTQWRMMTTLLLQRQLIPLCILAFQGLSSGNIDTDSQPIKFMVHEGLPVVVIQSFDAAMGIYADSPSIVSIATQSIDTKERVDSQLRSAARTLYSHPAPWGAQIVYSILSDQKLYPAWLNEMKAMAGRLRSVREKLFDVLANKLKTPGTWLHIKRSTGMQCTALLPPNQVNSLAKNRNILLNQDGSFSLGALNAGTIETLARGIDFVVRESIREQEEAQAQAVAMELALAAAREAAAKEEAEAAERAARDAEEKAREEDTLLMEASIADAMEMQRKEEEEEKRREEERREMDEAIRKAAERAEMQRKAEAILASIGAM